jgi:hypothetical protein
MTRRCLAHRAHSWDGGTTPPPVLAAVAHTNQDSRRCDWQGELYPQHSTAAECKCSPLSGVCACILASSRAAPTHCAPPIRPGRAVPSVLHLFLTVTTARCWWPQGGATVRGISKSTGARVTVLPLDAIGSTTTDRVVQLEGTMRECVGAFRAILARTDAQARRNAGEDVGEEDDMGDIAPPEEGEEDRTTLVPLKMLVKNDHIGHIIGKAGATIKRLSSDSSATIRINQPDMVPGPETLRIVTAEGTASALAAAYGLLLARLERVEDTPKKVEMCVVTPPPPPVRVFGVWGDTMVLPAQHCHQLHLEQECNPSLSDVCYRGEGEGERAVIVGRALVFVHPTTLATHNQRARENLQVHRCVSVTGRKRDVGP